VPRRTRITLTGASSKPVDAHVIDSGAGPRAVFLHGLVGLNEHWERVVGRVQGSVRCTRLEIPLLERSGPDCTVQGVEELTVKFLDQHVGEPAVLVGNSFGGHVALRVALHRPDLVRGLVLAGSSGLFERTLVKGAPLYPTREWVAEKIAELFFDPSKMLDDDIDRAHAVLSTRHGKRAMVRLSRTARRNNLGDLVGDIEAPTLLIWGRDDVVTPPSAAQGFLDLMQRAQIVWVDRCGHTPMLEEPEVFAAALAAFMRQLDERPAP
jgi:pimeloyl-ACP methyl ester carboxylesterase